MMDERDVDVLLSRGALSGREREDVLGRVLDRVAPRPVRPRLRVLAAASLVAATCAAVALVWNVQRRDEGAFAARGGTAVGVHVEVVCAGGRLEACPRGSHLLFAAAAGGRPGYLAAYAEPQGGGERIWYFSGDRASPPIVRGASPEAPVESAIAIGPEHALGTYSVHVLVGVRPLSRAEALHPDPKLVSTSETIALRIVP